MGSLIRFIAKTLIWMIIFIGLIVAGLRLTLANVDLFRADIEAWVAEEVGPGISFGKIRINWIGINPVLKLDSAAITLPDRSKPAAIDAISIQFDLWGSLVLGIPVVNEISGNIETVTIKKDVENRWWFNDIQLLAEKSSDAADDIEDLLASVPHYLQLEVARLIIEDEIEQQHYQIDNITADIQHHDDATHVQLQAKLPENLGGELTVKSILESEHGLVYFHSERLKLDPLASLIGIPMDRVTDVELVGEAWLSFSQHHVQGLDARISIDQGSFQSNLEAEAIPFRLSIQTNATRDQKNWTFNNRLEKLVVNQQGLPPINTQLRLIRDSRPGQIMGWIDAVSLPPYIQLSRNFLPPEIANQMVGSEIQGKLENILFDLPINNFSDLAISAKALGLGNKPVDAIPGIDKIDADIVFAKQQIRLDVEATQLSLDFVDEFRAPFQINNFEALVDAKSGDEGITISIPEFKAVNDDIKVAGRLWLEADQAESPFLSMRLAFDEGIGSRKSKYLPVKLLPKKALDWIDESIRSADISNGNVLFHGRLEDIEKLEQQKSGELMALFDIDNAEVMFDPDWAIASKGKGRLMFHNLGVDIRIDSVNYQNIENGQARITVPTFLNTVVIADIDARGPTEKALPIWLESPVGEDFREFAKNLSEPGGEASANIILSIPLEDDALEAKTEVIVKLENASVKAPAWGVELSRINGKILIDNDTISADDIKAYYFNDPVVVDIATDLSRQQTRVKSNGRLETSQLLNLLPQTLTKSLKGKSHWNVDMAIENKAKSGDQPVLTIKAASGLEGTAILMPEPFNKSPDVLRRTTGTIQLLANNEVTFDVQFGSHVKTRGRLENSELSGLQLADLDMAFATSLGPSQHSGIRLYGNLPKLSLDDWREVYRTEIVPRKQNTRNLLPLLKIIDLNVTQVSAFGRTMEHADILLEQSADGFLGHIDSSILKGKFDFPHKDSVQDPVVIDLEYVRIAPTQGNRQSTGLLPTDLFNMRMRSQEVLYDDKLVTDFEFDTSIDGDSLIIDTLEFRRDDVRFKYNGYWLYSPPTKQHETRLNASIKGSRFGQAMAELNFGDTIHNGTIKFKGELNWQDELFKPDWDTLNGKGRFKIENGILKDVEPGSGRFVGLFSLNSLPASPFTGFFGCIV